MRQRCCSIIAEAGLIAGNTYCRADETPAEALSAVYDATTPSHVVEIMSGRGGLVAGLVSTLGRANLAQAAPSASHHPLLLPP